MQGVDKLYQLFNNYVTKIKVKMAKKSVLFSELSLVNSCIFSKRIIE